MGKMKLGGGAGTRWSFPIETAYKMPGANQPVTGMAWYQNLPGWFFYHEDFLWDAFDIDEHPLAIYDASASGSPTTGLIADAVGGQYQIQLSSTSEAQLVGFHMAGNLYIQGNKPFIFEARVKTAHAMAANQNVVIGLASDVDTSTLDDITRNLWFRQAATADLQTEFDDATTDDDDNDSGVDITEDAFYIYRIEFDGSIVRMGLMDALGEGYNTVAEYSPAFGANNFQPVILAQKTTGATQPELHVDYVAFAGCRV
jgi:hypothetical protein